MNLIDAAARANIKRFVLLRIVKSEETSSVPHFHAKKVAEDLIKQSGVPYVFVRAPAFLDQSTDYIADVTKQKHVFGPVALRDHFIGCKSDPIIKIH